MSKKRLDLPVNMLHRLAGLGSGGRVSKVVDCCKIHDEESSAAVKCRGGKLTRSGGCQNSGK